MMGISLQCAGRVGRVGRMVVWRFGVWGWDGGEVLGLGVVVGLSCLRLC